MVSTSCYICKSVSVDRPRLLQSLQKHRREERLEDLGKVLLENTANVVESNSGFKFDFLYDYTDEVVHRNVTTKVCRTVIADIRVFYQYNSLLYLIYTTSEFVDEFKKRLSRAVTSSSPQSMGDSRFIEHVTIPSDTLQDFGQSGDVVEIKSGSWKDVETYASRGSLSGSLERSRYYQDFKEHGEPVLLRFESRRVGRTLAISTKGLVMFYGKDVDRQSMQDYIMSQVANRLEVD